MTIDNSFLVPNQPGLPNWQVVDRGANLSMVNCHLSIVIGCAKVLFPLQWRDALSDRQDSYPTAL